MGCCSTKDSKALNTAAKKRGKKYGKKKQVTNKNEPLIEPKQAKLEDSNMANYGSDEHKQLRQSAAGMEEAWVNMDKGIGLQIWRIEKFKVIPWPKKKYGKFYNGDSYILLHTMKSDRNKDKLVYDVYFWLGAETSQDEAGTAAYKTVELDDYLHDEPVQYREVQGNESKHFLDLFKKMTILEGGIDSGFHHVEKLKFNNRLLHIHGYGKRNKSNIQVYQVKISVSSMNNNDTFILDTGEILYQFNGNNSCKEERWRAAQIVNDIKATRGKCEVKLIDGLHDKSEDAQRFWIIIGCSFDDVNLNNNSKNDGADDDGKNDVELVLQKVSNASGHMVCKEIERGKKLDKKKLDTMDCFIVDGGMVVYVWCGKKSNKSEKKAAMLNAIEYLKLQGRDLNVPISRVIQGRETKTFWKVFDGKRGGGRKHMGKLWQKWFA